VGHTYTKFYYQCMGNPQKFACFFHFSPTKDLAPFSIHGYPTKKPSFKPINDQFFIVAGIW